MYISSKLIRQIKKKQRVYFYFDSWQNIGNILAVLFSFFYPSFVAELPIKGLENKIYCENSRKKLKEVFTNSLELAHLLYEILVQFKLRQVMDAIINTSSLLSYQYVLLLYESDIYTQHQFWVFVNGASNNFGSVQLTTNPINILT